MINLRELLEKMIQMKASDLHLTAGLPPQFRVDGSLTSNSEYAVLTPEECTRLAYSVLNEEHKRRFENDRELDLSFGIAGLSRFRCNVFLQRGVVTMAVRQIPYQILNWKQIGVPQVLADLVMRPKGMVLVTGPTGSGKSTTLYSALSTINQPDINIMTAEDPVEYNLMGINQVQMKDDIGLNFAAALRSFLRQDPDVVMVGEIRDYETAEIAVKAALTGHLVLSTLHTNDAPGTINRLLNMGIEPFMVASSVVLILAQRLARRICAQCKEETKLAEATLISAGFAPSEIASVKTMHGKGCATCSDTGYKGRVALYEVMPVGDAVRELILQGGSADEIKRKAIEAGMKTLRMAGLQKVREGHTTVEEVVGSTFAD